MNFELAKQLKEAGFPQSVPNSVDAQGWTFYQPTLSKLMESLPDHCGLQRDDWGWCMYVKGLLRESTISKTPEEAAAKLWLEFKGRKEIKEIKE